MSAQPEWEPIPEEKIAGLHRGIIAWFARNPVSANLLMVLIIIAGTLSAFNMPRTLTPDFEIYWLQIGTVYPGATPEEIEQSIVLKMEEALREVEGLESVVSRSFNSRALVRVEVNSEYDVNDVQAEVRSAIDSIVSFPQDVERPVIGRVPILRHVNTIELHGELDLVAMQELADEMEAELLRLPDISKVDKYGARDYEISIEVAEATLRKYGLTLEDVGAAVQRAAVDLPGGNIRTANGQVPLHAKGRRFHQQDFEEVTLLTFADGTRLLLRDIAEIRDGFSDDDNQLISEFNGSPSIGVATSAYNNQDVLDIAQRGREYAAQKQLTLPEGVILKVWADVSGYLNERLSMMQRNLFLGSLLVFLILAIFIDIKLAFWVMLGIPISFLGAYALMAGEPFNVTLNMVSLFALILVLGIVVDDAIIIGESTTAAGEKHGHSLNAVILGAQRVAVPAVFGVLTTVVAFSPTVLVSGQYAAFPNEIGYVVTLCLLFSLLESKLILPAHLAHTKPSTSAWLAPLRRVQAKSNYFLKQQVINLHYRPYLSRCVEKRYLTIAVFTAILVLSLGLALGGIIRFVLVDAVPGDFFVARVEMVDGTPDKAALSALRRLEERAYDMEREIQQSTGKPLLQNVNVWSEERLVGEVFLELHHDRDQKISGGEILERWRQLVGEIPGARILAFSNAEAGPEGNRAIALRVVGEDRDRLEQATMVLKNALQRYTGIFDVRTDISDRTDEIHLTIKPAAEALGLSLAEVGRQVRYAFYGYEAQRIQRGNDEVKVMVRYPLQDRKSINTLENMHIRTQDGAEVPLSSVAVLEVRPAPSKLVRIDGQPSIAISTNADTRKVSPSAVVRDINAQFKESMREEYGATLLLDEDSKAQNEMVTFLLVGFLLAALANYCLLAVPLRSYTQPLIVMGAIPFGIIGAMIGHLLLGLPISMFSLFGIIAVSGVVVNDGIIMVDFINQGVREGMSKSKAAVEAGARRFRPILLTSLTTFFGLLPIMLEQSVQARYVIPMAVSLSYGVLFATGITLFLLPCLYVALDDLPKLTRLYRRRAARASTASASSQVAYRQTGTLS